LAGKVDRPRSTTTRIKSAWIEHDRLAKYASDHFPVAAEII
jgi:endonuclease/exonuclease/phosphatase family metal-dependent hydrolase